MKRDAGIFGSLSVVGLVSLCCLGVGGIAGAAAIAGGGASTTAIATGASTLVTRTSASTGRASRLRIVHPPAAAGGRWLVAVVEFGCGGHT